MHLRLWFFQQQVEWHANIPHSTIARRTNQLPNTIKLSYSLIMGWLRHRISITLLRSTIRAFVGPTAVYSLVPVDTTLVSKESLIHCLHSVTIITYCIIM